MLYYKGKQKESEYQKMTMRDITNNNWAIAELKRIEAEKEAKKKREQEEFAALVEDTDDKATLSPIGRG